jgi:hypothetical protein
VRRVPLVPVPVSDPVPTPVLALPEPALPVAPVALLPVEPEVPPAPAEPDVLLPPDVVLPGVVPADGPVRAPVLAPAPDCPVPVEVEPAPVLD